MSFHKIWSDIFNTDWSTTKKHFKIINLFFKKSFEITLPSDELKQDLGNYYINTESAHSWTGTVNFQVICRHSDD